MIHWAWALGTLLVGIVAGFFILALLAADASDDSWRHGYKEGFQAGLNKDKE